MVVAALAAAGCSTTVDRDIERAVEEAERSEPAATAIAVETSSVATAASLGELLDELVGLAESLSETIVANEGQHDVLDRIDAVWEAARPGVADAASERVVLQIDRAISLLHRGVDRRRPADADRATINLRSLLAVFDAS